MSEVHNIFSALHFRPGVMWHIQLTVWAVIRFKSIDDLSCGTRFCLFSTIICWRWDRNQPSETEQERVRERERKIEEKKKTTPRHIICCKSLVSFSYCLSSSSIWECAFGPLTSHNFLNLRGAEMEREKDPSNCALFALFQLNIAKSAWCNNAQNDEFSANQ